MKKTRLLALALVIALIAMPVAWADPAPSVTQYERMTENLGAYECVVISGLVPSVFVPTGACGESEADYSTVTEMMQTYGEQYGIAAAINAGIFYNNGTELQYCFPYKQGDGVIISGGVVLKSTESIDHTECDILVFDEDGQVGWADYYADADALVSGEGVYYDMYGNEVAGKRIVSAVTGFVPILIGGRNIYDQSDAMLHGYDNYVIHYEDPNVRQVFGVRADGSYVILSNMGAWTLSGAAEAARAEQCVFAYNLDGGRSAETVLGHERNGVYEVETIRKQAGREPRALPTYIIFTEPDRVPVSATPTRLEARVNEGARFSAGVTFADIAQAITVTQYFTNINGKESSRTVYSRYGLEDEELLHCVISGTIYEDLNYSMEDFARQSLFPRRKISTSPNGVLYYTKTAEDMKVSLINNDNTRLDGKYYDYSTGYTLWTGADLSKPGQATILAIYTPGYGQPMMTAEFVITIE